MDEEKEFERAWNKKYPGYSIASEVAGWAKEFWLARARLEGERVKVLEEAIRKHREKMADRESYVMLGPLAMGRANLELYAVLDKARKDGVSE